MVQPLTQYSHMIMGGVVSSEHHNQPAMFTEAILVTFGHNPQYYSHSNHSHLII